MFSREFSFRNSQLRKINILTFLLIFICFLKCLVSECLEYILLQMNLLQNKEAKNLILKIHVIIKQLTNLIHFYM